MWGTTTRGQDSRPCTWSLRIIAPPRKPGTMFPYYSMVGGYAMILHLFYYQLVVLGLLWLCVMLHHIWLSRDALSHQRRAEPEPIKLKRKRSNEPTPFAGLTHKPPCALCEQEARHPDLPPPVPPDPMAPTNRRPRVIDTSRHFCPHAGCAYRGWLGFGNLRANGHPNGSPWRQFHCTSCEGYFLETHGTIFHGKRVPVELIVRVLACLAEGLGIRATARVLAVDPNTVLQWIHVLLPALLAALRTLGDAPARSLTALAQRLGVSEDDVATVVTPLEAELTLRTAVPAIARLPPFTHDGTERRIVCPQDPPEQAACYSGKKKDHTVKNVLLVNALLTILFLSATYGGHVHDKRIAEATPYPLPAGSRLLQDLGFLAFTLPQVEILMPTKKPRGRN